MIDEFYAMVKKNVEFTMSLNRGQDGVVSMPDRIVSAEFPMGEKETEWFEMNQWCGISTHLGGLHLAQLSMAKRMAEETGDTQFAGRCADWIAAGQHSLEQKMWEGDHYTTYYDEQNDVKSDFLFSNTFDGESLTILESLPCVFDAERRGEMLETIRRLALREGFFPPVQYFTPDGRPVKSGAENDSEISWAYDEYDFRLYVTTLLLIQFIQIGDTDFALNILRDYHDRIICAGGLSWSNPEHTEGKRMTPYGFEDAHNLVIWSLPTLILDGDVRSTCSAGGFAHRIIDAGKDHSVRAQQ